MESAHAPSDPHPNKNADPHPNAHSDFHSNSHSDVNANAHDDRYRYSNADPNADGDANPHADTHSKLLADAAADSDDNVYANSYPFADSDGNAICHAGRITSGHQLADVRPGRYGYPNHKTNGYINHVPHSPSLDGQPNSNSNYDPVPDTNSNPAAPCHAAAGHVCRRAGCPIHCVGWLRGL